MSIASLISGVDLTQVLMELENGNLTTAMVAKMLASSSPQLASTLSAMSTEQLITIIKALDFSEDVNVGTNMLRTIWVLLAISTLVLIARLAVKLRTVRRVYYDDAIIIAALIFGYLHAIFITLAYENGLGRHMVFLSNAQREYTLRIGFISLAWGFLSPMLGRISFCIFLLFVAGIDPTIKKWTIYVFMMLQLLINLGSVVAMYSQCGTHLNVMFEMKNWTEYSQYCWKASVQSDYGYFAGSFNTITDLYLTVLPGVLILHTRMPLRQKICLAFLLCLSSLAMVASIVKTYESKALSQILDYTYDLVPYVIWISIELNVVITVASIPLLRPLLTGLVNRISGTLAKHGTVQEKFESISLGSIISKARPKVASSNIPSSSSQECIAPMRDPFAITHTVEVVVSSSPSQVSLVHAALVGLVEDETRVAAIWH